MEWRTLCSSEVGRSVGTEIRLLALKPLPNFTLALFLKVPLPSGNAYAMQWFASTLSRFKRSNELQ